MSVEQNEYIYADINVIKACRKYGAEMAWFAQLPVENQWLFVVARIEAIRAAVQCVWGEINHTSNTDDVLRLVNNQLLIMLHEGWQPSECQL